MLPAPVPAVAGVNRTSCSRNEEACYGTGNDRNRRSCSGDRPCSRADRRGVPHFGGPFVYSHGVTGRRGTEPKLRDSLFHLEQLARSGMHGNGIVGRCGLGSCSRQCGACKCLGNGGVAPCRRDRGFFDPVCRSCNRWPDLRGLRCRAGPGCAPSRPTVGGCASRGFGSQRRRSSALQRGSGACRSHGALCRPRSTGSMSRNAISLRWRAVKLVSLLAMAWCATLMTSAAWHP